MPKFLVVTSMGLRVMLVDAHSVSFGAKKVARAGSFLLGDAEKRISDLDPNTDSIQLIQSI